MMAAVAFPSLSIEGVKPDRNLAAWLREARGLWAEFEKTLPPRMRGLLDQVDNPWADETARLRGGATGILAEAFRSLAGARMADVVVGNLGLADWRDTLQTSGARMMLAAAAVQYGDDPLLQLVTAKRLTEAIDSLNVRVAALADRAEAGEISAAQAAAWAGQSGRGLVRAAGQMGSAARFEDQPIQRVMTAFENHCATCPGKADLYADLEDYLARAGGWPGDGSDECHGNCLCSLEPATEFSVFGQETEGLLTPSGPAGSKEALAPVLPLRRPRPLPLPLVAPPEPVVEPTPTSFLPPPTAPGAKWSTLPALGAVGDKDLHHAFGEWGPKLSNPAYGAVLFDDDGRVLLRRPKGEFGGYAWTWPKGKPEPGEHPHLTAVSEVAEETGYLFEAVGFVPGGHSSGSSTSYFFLGRAKSHDSGQMDDETEAVEWVEPEKAVQLIKLSSNAAGRKRDLEILEAALAERQKLLAGKTYVLHPAAPPPPAAKPKPPPSPPASSTQAVTPPETLTLPARSIFPERQLHRVGGQQGSNPAAWYADEQGQRFYVKFPNATGQVGADLVGRELARAMGLPSTGGERVRLPGGGLGIASQEEPLTALGRDALRKRGKVERAAHLVHAAWTRNWDVVGQGYDNLLLNADGKLVVVDHGGGLLWRAQGALKPDGLPPTVTELGSLRDGTNPQTAAAFGDLDDATVARAIRRGLKKLTDGAISDIVAEGGFADADARTIADGLRQRRQYLLEWADGALDAEKQRKARPTAGKPLRPPHGRSGHPDADTWRQMPSDLPPDEAWELVRARRSTVGHVGSQEFSSRTHWSATDSGTRKAKGVAILREMGFAGSDAQATALVNAVDRYSRDGFADPAVCAKVQEYIQAMPGYRGQLSRGMSLPVDTSGWADVSHFRHAGGRGLQVGQEFGLDQVRSFSSSSGFSSHNVQIIIEHNTRGASIRGLSAFYSEQEVVVGTDSRLRVKRIDRRKGTSSQRVIIYCEEVNPVE